MALLYRFVYLSGRLSTGALATAQSDELHALGELFEGDPQRRKHRRFPVEVEAVIRQNGGWYPVDVKDFSGGGMLISTYQNLKRDDELQLRVGVLDETEYLFSCKVERVPPAKLGEPKQVGLSFQCTPLQVRRAAPAAACHCALS